MWKNTLEYKRDSDKTKPGVGSVLEVNALDSLGLLLTLTPRFRFGYLKRPCVHGLLRHP